MYRLRKLSAAVCAVIAASSALSGCSKTTGTTSSGDAVPESSKTIAAEQLSDKKGDTGSAYFKSRDIDGSYDSVGADILLKGGTAEIKGSGAELRDKVVMVNSGGTYRISGTLDDGQVCVSTKEKVHIILDGAEISCSDSSPFFIEDGDNAVITVCGENTLSDTANHLSTNEPDAVIFSKDDLSINGAGVLNINAAYNEGITSKNDLRIYGVTLNITSEGSALKGKDSVAVMDSVINVTSSEDGIKSSNSEEDDKGYIVVESGELSITAANDAFQAETDIIVNGGTFSIKTGNGAAQTNVEASDSSSTNKPFGGRGGMMFEGNSAKTDDSEKGLKAGRSVIINGGTVSADCADDAVHSAGTIELNDGLLTLNAGDDGLHADESIDINGGNLTVSSSYEGIEATVINVNDGSVSVRSTDDGFNASEGSSDANTDTSGFAGFGGGFGDVSENCQLNIKGGSVYVDADGDGLDSNGVININGGTVIVNGPVNDGNGALDSGTDIFVGGGTLIAAGSSGMAETPSDTSKQCSVAACFDSTMDADTTVCLKDSDGRELVVFKPCKKFSSVIISTPEIARDKEYSVYYGGTVSGSGGYGYYPGCKCTGGTLLGTKTADSAVTQIGEGRLGMTGGGKFPGQGRPFADGERPDDMPEGMTPPDDWTPPGDFDENKTPPEGFDDNRMPPGGFGDHGGFGGEKHGGMAPAEGDTVPTGAFGGRHHNEGSGHHRESENCNVV